MGGTGNGGLLGGLRGGTGGLGCPLVGGGGLLTDITFLLILYYTTEDPCYAEVLRPVTPVGGGGGTWVGGTPDGLRGGTGSDGLPPPVVGGGGLLTDITFLLILFTTSGLPLV